MKKIIMVWVVCCASLGTLNEIIIKYAQNHVLNHFITTINLLQSLKLNYCVYVNDHDLNWSTDLQINEAGKINSKSLKLIVIN